MVACRHCGLHLPEAEALRGQNGTYCSPAQPPIGRGLMPTEAPEHSWFGPSALEPVPEPPEGTQEFARLWQAFMTARLTLGLVLVVLQTGLYATGSAQSRTLIAVCVAYFLGALATRLFVRPRYLGQAFNRAWGVLIGLDIGVFLALQQLQGNNLNYTPLFALPILLASVLGVAASGPGHGRRGEPVATA